MGFAFQIEIFTWFQRYISCVRFALEENILNFNLILDFSLPDEQQASGI